MEITAKLAGMPIKMVLMDGEERWGAVVQVLAEGEHLSICLHHGERDRLSWERVRQIAKERTGQ